MEQEKIICACVRYHNKLWRGNRHNNALKAMEDELSYTMNRKEIGEISEYIEQGFLTSKNRYVGREEGYIIAVEAGQYRPSKLEHLPENCSNTLFSEDLY